MKVAVIGASGRMGQAVLAELAKQQLSCRAAIVGAASSHLGKAVEHLPETALTYSDGSELQSTDVDVMIDFSLPDALVHNLTLAQRIGAAIVVCTTGLDDTQRQQLGDASQSVPVLYAANTSVGICVMEQLVALASGALPAADIEIVEAHHQAKRDAPSGTALVLGEAAAAGRGQQLAALNAGLRGAGQRQAGSIGFAVLRAADIIGEHQVLLAQPGERIELTHRVGDRKVFARGAVQAARWLASEPAGYYEMRDMLDMKTLLQRLVNEI
ncbi:4-hydroxy-tetrahydrodipicolinate reductase [Pseudidiomarina sp. E22-M8]|uniref:4-hydroxy-tetrahydrodipicolinate reductase n=1 Tax=Pseudidiomarina sp. E22-M8 TaxID=3424768 RepID=UPI00403C633D